MADKDKDATKRPRSDGVRTGGNPRKPTEATGSQTAPRSPNPSVQCPPDPGPINRPV